MTKAYLLQSSSTDVVETAARMEKSLAAKTSASRSQLVRRIAQRPRKRGRRQCVGGLGDDHVASAGIRSRNGLTEGISVSGRLGGSRCSCWRWRLLLRQMLRLMLLRLMLLRLMLLRLMLLRLMLLRPMLLRLVLLRLMLRRLMLGRLMLRRLVDDDQVRSACN
ncbi:uncharacterized protein LOC128265099 [Drosophila gunungcola]|uniref:uncharacterized protein LOC128265099 n=1 Tax=Drosophila gunungcola TaxID=103775 RepID=UPI0022E8F1E8|nr:uncharacterized protein LOC128265099 [Drosophila gunungcola]